MIDGTLIDVDGRPALRFERLLTHPVERVWRAITDPAELDQWFVSSVAWTPAVGETFEAMEQTVVITEVDPPRVLGWTWGDEAYRFVLVPDGDGCRLSFVHVFADTYGPAAQHAAGWDCYLDRLDALLAGEPLDELAAHAPIAERHERYAAAFGQDPTTGRRMIASMGFRGLTLEGSTLRLERRFAHPVDRLWRALTHPDACAAWFPSGDPMVVIERVEPTLLVGSWFGDTLRFELTSEGSWCVLVFTHEVAEPATTARTAAGWDRCYARLDAALAGVTMSDAESLDAWPEVHERYAETFGVDPELGRQAYAQAVSDPPRDPGSS